MARLVAVCKNDDCKISRRQLPITVDDDLKMVIQFNDSCVDCENEALKGVKQKGLEHFVQRFSSLSKDEVAVELMVSSKNIMNLLTHLVPCVGCRRSVEKMFNQLVETQYPVLEPLVVTRRGELSINRNYLFDPKALFALFHIHRAKLNTLMESIPKSKKNKRCNLHSLDTHKSRSTGSWFEIWDLLAPKCKQEVVLVDAHSLQVTLDTYLRKHRFCAECKSKVQCAYRILIGEKTENQEGYCAALYEGLRCCAQEKHIHMRCETNFIANLIDRAEPELSGGSRRDRHAKTLDIAQEEVLTCLGIYIHDRLHRIWQKLKAEEQTWQILFYIGVDALEKSFEVALERKQGVSNLELICEELLEEERVKEQKREQKRQKKKKKKAKSNSLLHEDEQEKENENSSRCECDNKESACIPFKHRSSCEEKCILGDENSNTSLVSHESCRGPGVGGGGTDRPLRSGSQNSDCGYLSDMETCDSCENCSAPSSNGSDVACSDGACSGHEGSDSMCGSITDALDVCTKCLSDTSHKQGNGHGYLLNKLDEDPCSCASCSSENSNQNHMPLSLLDMLEAPCNTEEDDFISEEEINQFKANQDLVSQKRQELRENLRKQFNNFQKSKGCDHPKCPSSVCKELGAAMKSCRM